MKVTRRNFITRHDCFAFIIGNVNLMRAREGVMNTDIFGQKLMDLYPVVEPNLSDSGSVDTVLEFLVMAGQRSLPEAVMTMVTYSYRFSKINAGSVN